LSGGHLSEFSCGFFAVKSSYHSGAGSPPFLFGECQVNTITLQTRLLDVIDKAWWDGETLYVNDESIGGKRLCCGDFPAGIRGFPLFPSPEILDIRRQLAPGKTISTWLQRS